MAYLLDTLVQASAERHPDRPAVVSDRGSITYAELDAAAGRLAAALREQGVGLGDRVALQLEKSIEAVVSAYGIMRAGAAYVPIDAGAPARRCAQIATDCEIAALVSDPAHVEALRAVDPAAAPRGIVVGDAPPAGFDAWADVQAAPADPRARTGIDADLAYILYTSGSTGRPKGVMVSHRGALTFVDWATATFGLGADDVVSSHAPLHFDLSTFDLFAAAAAGATVALVPRIAAMFPVRLADWIRASAVTVWYSVPSALAMLVRYGELGVRTLDSLRLVLFAGEVFPVRYLRELMSLVPQARFFNLYGPTETNVCTYHEVDRPPAADDPPVPIGRACENTRCVAIDDSGAVVSEVGAEGELVVTGSTVARGYWGDPDLSAARFPRPHTCRTGDIVELLEAGPRPSFRFVGRRDDLVKSRGYRIELGEVEAALYAHPAVTECVAVAVPDELVGNRIAAFCTVSGDVTAQELARSCGERVPPYMVPDPITLVEALPRTANDKYDRVRLSQWAAGTTGT